MGTDLAHPSDELSGALMESILLSGDLAKLTPDKRVHFYTAVCKSLGLNPLTKPFEYINLNGKLRLYATKDCTDQLRKRDSISIRIVNRELVDGVYIVTAQAQDREGRTDESVGAVPIADLKGEARSNAVMKAETKAKRRVTLSICGMGMLDASETDSIPDAQRVSVSTTGQIEGPVAENPKEAQRQVKERKLAEAKRLSPVAEPDFSKGWFKVMLDGFAAMKEAIGNEAYYRVLGNNGYTHANEIGDRTTAMRIYREMAANRSETTEEEPAGFVGEPA